MRQWWMFLDKGGPVDDICLDFARAFDRVPHRRRVSRLGHIGIHGRLLSWMEASLSVAPFKFVLVNLYLQAKAVLSDVPHSSVLTCPTISTPNVRSSPMTPKYSAPPVTLVVFESLSMNSFKNKYDS